MKIRKIYSSAFLMLLTLSGCGGESSEDPPAENLPPSANAGASSNTSGEAPLTVLLDASASSDSDGSITTYQWDLGDDQNNTSRALSHTYTTPGNYTVRLTVMDDEGASDWVELTITVLSPPVNLPPVAVLSTSVSNGIAPLAVQFDGSASTDDTGIETYQWVFGDGMSSNLSNPSHTYTTAGTYNGSLTVTDEQGLSSSQNFTIIVDAQSPVSAAEIYQAQCSLCHGDNGEGNIGPSLQSARPRDELIAAISRMPSAGGPDCMGLQNCEPQIADYILNNFVRVIDPDSLPFTCASVNEPVAVSNVRRLTRTQIIQSITELMYESLPAQNADNVIDWLHDSFSNLPQDGHSSGYEALDQRISSYHVEKYIEMAFNLGQFMTWDNNWTYWAGENCQFSDDTCKLAIIENIGPKILRRALSDSDRAYFLTAADPQELVTQLFLSPDFLFHAEIYGSESQSGFVDLSAQEIANRLAFLFWNSAPDEYLLNAVESGRIINEYDQVVEEVFNNTKTEDAITAFYNQWMRTKEIPLLTDVESGLNEFIATDYGTSGDTSLTNIDIRQYRTDAAQEVEDFGRYMTFFSEGTFTDLFTSNQSFAWGHVAQAYGVGAWSGDYLSPVALPATERAGLLTRAAFHLYGNKDSRPVLKGARIIEDILCEHIPLPEDNSSPAGTNVTNDMTTRERITEITEQDGTACATCHLNRINPLGFALEDYDGYGRFRDFELLYEPWGAIRSTATVNASSTVTLDSSPIAVNGGVELSEAIANSPKAAACFARQVFRFGMARMEDTQADSCMLNTIYEDVRNEPLREVFKQLALHPDFKKRRVFTGE